MIRYLKDGIDWFWNKADPDTALMIIIFSAFAGFPLYYMLCKFIVWLAEGA